MDVVAAEMVATALAPLVFGSVALIHQLRGRPRDVGRSVLIAAGIWSGIGLGIATLLVGMATLR